MSNKQKILDLKLKIAEFVKQDKKVLEAKKAAFKLVGKLTVSRENEKTIVFFKNLPAAFRNVTVTLSYENKEEALKLGLLAEGGRRKYFFLEGYIVSLGTGACILDTPIKASERDWQAVCQGNIPKKFLRVWVKEYLR